MIWPATVLYIAARAPISTVFTLTFAAFLPVIKANSATFFASGLGAKVIPKVIASLNRVRYALPLFVYSIVALSRFGTTDFGAQPDVALTNTSILGPELATPGPLAYHGPWYVFPVDVDAVTIPLVDDNVSLQCTSDLSKHERLIDLAKDAAERGNGLHGYERPPPGAKAGMKVEYDCGELFSLRIGSQHYRLSDETENRGLKLPTRTIWPSLVPTRRQDELRGQRSKFGGKDHSRQASYRPGRAPSARCRRGGQPGAH